MFMWKIKNRKYGKKKKKNCETGGVFFLSGVECREAGGRFL
jgi:hypothetical protein